MPTRPARRIASPSTLVLTVVAAGALLFTGASPAAAKTAKAKRVCKTSPALWGTAGNPEGFSARESVKVCYVAGVPVFTATSYRGAKVPKGYRIGHRGCQAWVYEDQANRLEADCTVRASPKAGGPDVVFGVRIESTKMGVFTVGTWAPIT